MSTPEAAEQLTRFLIQPDRYGGKSPLQQRVDTEIAAMATQIAKEVVAENPDLADKIRRLARDTIREAMWKDTYLSSTVTSAIARVLTELALQRSEEDES